MGVYKRWMFLAVLLVGLSGCVTPKKDIDLPDEFWQQPKQKVQIAIIEAPKSEVHLVGQQGLLEYGINSTVNRKLDKHLATYSMEWYTNIPSAFSKQLKKHRMIPLETLKIKADKKSRESVLAQGETVLLLELKLIGALREYQGVFPKGPPKAACLLKGELIDSLSKKTLWYHEVSITHPVEKGNWDEPPTFPTFTQTLNQVVQSAQEELIDSFFSGQS